MLFTVLSWLPVQLAKQLTWPVATTVINTGSIMHICFYVFTLIVAIFLKTDYLSHQILSDTKVNKTFLLLNDIMDE